MYLIINILSIFVFLGVAYLFSDDRKTINWKSIGIVVALQVLLAWFFISFDVGRNAITAVANGFVWLISTANAGIAFALPDWLNVKGGPNFVTSALLPILLVVPLFDILNYIGVLPWVVKWIGRGLSIITGQPKYEAFFSVEMMFLGNTEVLAVSKTQLQNMNARRNFTLALMSMSSITAAMVGVYAKIVPGEYVLTAVPLNILGSIVISSIMNPVKVSEKDDVIYGISEKGQKKEPFFSFLGDSILGAGKLILIIIATVIAFVSLAALIDKIFSLTGLKWLSLENIFGIIMFPFAWLLGFNPEDAFKLARFMGTKLVTNEFVVMADISKNIMGSQDIFSNKHARVIMTVFLTSFANFGTVGMIIGTFKGLVDNEKVGYVSKRAPKMLIAGILVSLLSAATAGLFAW